MSISQLDVTIDRPLPQSPDAERAVLGAILINNAAYWRVKPILAVDDFFKDAHRTIYRQMEALAGRGDEIDSLTLREELREANLLDQVGGFAYLSSLVDVVPDIANVERYAEFVARKAARRRLIIVGNQLMRRALDETDEGADAIAADALAELTKHATIEGAQAKPLVTVMGEAYDEAERRYAKDESLALKTSFERLNSYNVLTRTLIIVASPSNHGKTAFGVDLAADLAEHGQSTAFYTLESTPHEIVWRHVSSRTGVPHTRVRDWSRIADNDADMRKLGEVRRRAQKLPLYVTRRIRTIDAIYAECRRLKTLYGLDAAMIDYFQLIGFPGGPRDREERFAVIAQRLLEMALDLDILVCALSQLNKDRFTRDSGRLHQGDLKYASAIAESARAVLMFQRPHADDKSNADLRPCQVLFQVEKNNEGRTGDYEAHFDEVTQKFGDGSCSDNRCRRLLQPDPNERNLFNS
jgi:replicative DNA helicase